MKVVAFDIGIKNLALCAMDSSHNIIGWENVNLLLEGQEAESSKCNYCKSKPLWSIHVSGDEEKAVCKRHIPASMPCLSDASGNICKKIPSLAVLKDIAIGYTGSGKKKEDVVRFLKTKYAFPIVKVKVPKATDSGLDKIHDKIRLMIDNRRDIFQGCTQVLLENQPAFKNPTMKSVQILLFATLRDFYYNTSTTIPSFHLIHAGKKVKGATKGDAGYSERKDGSEARVKKWLEEKNSQAQFKNMFTAAQKKSDLADALCMCVDYIK
jgi:hypothetical protein